jgi:hypothetical protein
MRSERNLRIGGALAVLVFAATAARAEVAALWPASGQPGTKVIGIKLMAIGDDPDPINPTVWHQFSAPGSGRVPLNPEGEANGDGFPAMVSHPVTGALLVAWSKSTPGGFDVVFSRFVDGAWSVPQVVAGGVANDLDPQLVVDDAGVVHLFYWQDGASPQVMRVQTADLVTWTAPQLVSEPGEDACRPAAAVFQGVLRVAYEVHDFGFGNTPRQVVLAREEGGSFVKEVVAITSNFGIVAPEVHVHAGRLWVDWVDAENAEAGEVAWTRLDVQGHWEPIRYEPFENAAERHFIVRGGVRMLAIQ